MTHSLKWVVSDLSGYQPSISSMRERIRFYFSILMESRKLDNLDTPATIEGTSGRERALLLPVRLRGAARFVKVVDIIQLN